MHVDDRVCVLSDYPSLVEGESHGILLLLIILFEYHFVIYLDTCSGFEAAKTAPWPSR